MKTLYIDIDEEISQVIEKVTELKARQVLIVVPKGAELFSNTINLRLLKEKIEKDDKQLLIFTHDQKGRSMIEKVGLKLYEGAVRRRQLSSTGQLASLPQKSIQKLEKKKVSISEISQLPSHSSERLLSNPQKKERRQHQRDWAQFFLFNTIRKRTIAFFTLMAFLSFFIVLYIAIPSATISLTPATNVVEKTVNLTFADPKIHGDLFRQPSNHALQAVLLEEEVKKDMSATATGKVFTGSSATCRLRLLNQRTSPWPLIPNTRFQDSSGVVFRLQESIQVPAARFEIAKDDQGNAVQKKLEGSLIVTVTADEKDENGNILGARGNLPSQTTFTLPGLSPFNQTLLSAINDEPCTGGITDFYTIVTEDDVEASREKMEEVLKEAAKKALLDRVDNTNLERGQGKATTDLSLSRVHLFANPRALLFELQEITVPENIIGTKAENFTVSGTMSAKGLAYEELSYFEILENALSAKVHPEKVLAAIEYDSTTSTIVYSDSDLESLSKVKVSVTVRGREEYNFDPDSPSGRQIVDRIMGYVPGKAKDEALYFISNLEQIQRAHISIWPFWKQYLPERTSSISITVR
jgi:hypothetical protein